MPEPERCGASCWRGGRALRSALSLAALLLVMAACASRAPDTAQNRRDVLRIAIPQDAKSLDPLLVSDTIGGFVGRFMFEPLISADRHGNPVPILAAAVPTRQNHGISADGRTIRYRLRSDARWTDGVRVTARDVKFSWQAIENPANNVVSRNGYDDIAAVDTPDERSVVVHLKTPFAPFVNTFFAESDQPYSIVPAHVLERFPNLNTVAFNEHPDVSDGPFRFERWLHADRIDLRANDAFFLGRPKLRRISLRIVPDENTAVDQLRTHAIDYMFQPSAALYPTIRQAGLHSVWVDTNGYEGLAINTSRKPLDDARVRLAIAYAIDKHQLVRTLTFGQEAIASEDLPGWMWAANPQVAPYPHDVARARSLLRRAGVKLPLSLTIVAEAASLTRKREALEVQAMLREIGISVEVKTYPGDLLYAPAGAGGIVNGGKFDLLIIPWYGGIDPDNSSAFMCANYPPHGYNVTRYCNAEMDRLESTARTHEDRRVRRAAYASIEALVRRDNPIVPFWWQRQQEAFAVKLKGFAPNPVTESWNAWEWSL